jgi:aldose 1-epimerase
MMAYQLIGSLRGSRGRAGGEVAEAKAHRVRAVAAIPFIIALATAGAVGSTQGSSESIGKAPFGSTSGRVVELYTLRNRQGMEARIATYGGIVVALNVPDRHGHFADVVLGYDTLDGYLKKSPYFGALIGRYANRIARGTLRLDGVAYRLPTNDAPNTLHGGTVGFDKVLWTVDSAKVTADGPQLTLSYISRDGEQGFPGKLSVTATYTLLEDNSLRVKFGGTTDRDTVVNLTNHSYFNLRGTGDVLGHIVQINADRFTPVDDTLIPTGELRPVEETPFDFRKPTAIGAHIGTDDQQLRFGKGYDHNWVLNASRGTLRLNATVYEPTSGRVLEVLSDQPGIQFYSGNFLDGSIIGKLGQRYGHRSGFCMEPQYFPDSPNHPSFPTTVLKVGQTYRSTIIYRFETR